VLLAAGLVALLVALTEGERWGWQSPAFVLLLSLGLATLAVWVVVELRVAEPMVDMRIMRRRPVLLTNATALIAGFAMIDAFVLVPQFVTTPTSTGYGFGASPTMAGLYLLPSSLTMLFAGPVAGVLGRRHGSKWPLALGMGLVATGAALLAAWHDEPAHVIGAMVLLGAGAAAAFAAMAALITESVPQSDTGIATGMNTVMRTVGGVIGGQLGAALLTSYAISETGHPGEQGYSIAFASSAVAAAIAGCVAILITPSVRAKRRLATAQAFDQGL
jgi:MFS family permease